MLLAALSRSCIFGVQKFEVGLALYRLFEDQREREIAAHQHNALNI